MNSLRKIPREFVGRVPPASSVAPFPPARNRCQGFSLLELIMVIVIVGIVAVPLMNGLMTMGGWLDTPIESVPVGSQLVQECAEHIMYLRRMEEGYGSISEGDPSNVCDALPTLPTDYTRTVVVTGTDSGTTSACPTSDEGACKLVQITVDKGASEVGNATFMLVDY